MDNWDTGPIILWEYPPVTAVMLHPSLQTGGLGSHPQPVIAMVSIWKWEDARLPPCLTRHQGVEPLALFYHAEHTADWVKYPSRVLHLYHNETNYRTIRLLGGPPAYLQSPTCSRPKSFRPGGGDLKDLDLMWRRLTTTSHANATGGCYLDAHRRRGEE